MAGLLDYPALLAALACVTGPAFAQGLEFKGIPLGATVEQARVRMVEIASDWSCQAATADGRTICTAEGVEYAGASTAPTMLIFRADRLVHVVVRPDARQFAEVLQAITQRHGKGQTAPTQTVQTAGGAALQQVSVTWTRPGWNLVASKYGADVRWSSVTLIASDEAKGLTREKQKKIADGI